MTTVYFKRLKHFDNATVSAAAQHLLAHFLEAEAIELAAKVPIKVHFGEKGNTTFIAADCYDGIIDLLTERGAASCFIETNVLYRGERTTRANHIRIAHQHGFKRLPIEIADGDHGEAYYQAPIDKVYYKTGKYGLGFRDYRQIIVCSHFKGHGMAGFGGAIKQLSMGFASRGGKMAQHAKLVPAVNQTKCVACGACIPSCDVQAIAMSGKAQIDQQLCVGCAGCIAICPVGAIHNDWEAANFMEKVSEYAYGAQRDKNFIYLNFLMNITEGCDCVDHPMALISDNIGLLIGSDPVAIDLACYNLINQNRDEALFSDGLLQIEHAKRIGFGDVNYKLIEVESN